MKLKQLEYIVEVVDHNLNVSAAADSLEVFQSGISKQIALFEQELGIKVYERNGKYLNKLTPEGEEIVKLARGILAQTKGIRSVAQSYHNPDEGKLEISATHTVIRYILPPIIQYFRLKYPKVSLHMHQGTPSQMAKSVTTGVTDFVIATEALDLFEQNILLPCFYWNRSIIIPKNHPLATIKLIQLEDLAQFELVTYVFAFKKDSDMDRAFKQKSLKPNIIFTATDTDIIKSYVRMGVGVGIIASIAYDPIIDEDLIIKDVSHLFDDNAICIGFSSGTYITDYMFDFIEKLAPHLTKDVVINSLNLKNNRQRKNYFNRLNIPRI